MNVKKIQRDYKSEWVGWDCGMWTKKIYLSEELMFCLKTEMVRKMYRNDELDSINCKYNLMGGMNLTYYKDTNRGWYIAKEEWWEMRSH